jgi:hypothetical protein
MPTAKKIDRLEMRERRWPDFTAIRPVAAVGDEVDAEFPFRRLDGGVDLAWRHVKALAVKLEMLDRSKRRFCPMGISNSNSG